MRVVEERERAGWLVGRLAEKKQRLRVEYKMKTENSQRTTTVSRQPLYQGGSDAWLIRILLICRRRLVTLDLPNL